MKGLLSFCVVVLTVAGTARAQAPDRQSLAYREAYAYGCLNGRVDAARPGTGLSPLDPVRYARDPNYRQGWDTGYGTCYEQEYRTPKMQRH